MKEIAQSIDLKLSEKLRDQNYRKKFFLAEASARIASQLIALRKKRGLSQGELAEAIGTKQPAISRVERAGYQNWSFNTLRSIADVLDARIRVVIESSEDILCEYERHPYQEKADHLAAAEFPPTAIAETKPADSRVSQPEAVASIKSEPPQYSYPMVVPQ